MSLEMDRDRVIEALTATTLAGNTKEAGKYLEQLTLLPGFGPELLRFAVDKSLSPTIKHAAIIYLKNMIIKHWAKDDEEDSSYIMNEEDRHFVRENIIDAIVGTEHVPVRAQLCVGVQNIARKDYPASWSSLPPKVSSLLQTSSGPHWLGAVMALYRISKIYEFKRQVERGPLTELMNPILPHLFQRFQHLIDNDSEESVLLQKVMLKLVYSMTQFSLNLAAFSVEALDGWLTVCRQVIVRPVSSEVETLETNELKESHEQWKLRKWAAKILERIFERYGAPGQVESGYAEFANHFLQTHSVPSIEVFLTVLSRHQQGTFVSTRVSHLALSFLSTGISHAHAWKAIKPHFMLLAQHVIFPFLCHTEEDEELWEDDVEEYIRFKYDIFEDINNPSNSAGSLLAAACKRKDVVQPILAFIITVLTTRANEPIAVDGALHMAGELAAQLVTSKKYKKDCEKLLDAHVIPRLTNESRFVRARAAWCLKTFSATQFNTPRILKQIVDGVVQRLLDDNEELPVKVESAITIQFLLDDQDEKTTEMFKPYIGNIIPAVLKLVSQSQVEELCGVVDELIDKYLEDIVPVAASIAHELSSLFLQVISADDADERTPTLMSIISTLANILDVTDDHKEIMMAVESSVLLVIKAVFSTANIDYYDDVLMLVQSLITSHVSLPMWDVFSDIFTAFQQGNNTVMMYSDVMPAIHLYITTDTEAFLARPERLNIVLEMVKTVMQDSTQGDDNQLSAAKTMEILLLQCGRAVVEAVPVCVMLSLQRLALPFEGLSELQPMCLCVIIAALYTHEEVTINILQQLAPNAKPLDFIGEQLVLLGKSFDGVHDRKMALLGWCQLLQMPSEKRPAVIAYQPKKILETCIFLFEGLQRAMKMQAEFKAADEDDSSDDEEEESDDEESAVTPGKGKKNRHRKISEDLGDSEDEIDEGNLEYLENLRRAHGDEDSDDDEDEGDGFIEETDTEPYDTPLDREDAPDLFVLFKHTMESFERTEPELFSNMVNTLDEQQAGQLRALITECDRHASLENSKQLENTGGYRFNVDAPVPTSFNFGNPQ